MHSTRTAWMAVAVGSLLGACAASGANRSGGSAPAGGNESPCALTSAELAAPAVSTANYNPTPPPAPSASQ